MDYHIIWYAVLYLYLTYKNNNKQIIRMLFYFQFVIEILHIYDFHINRSFVYPVGDLIPTGIG